MKTLIIYSSETGNTKMVCEKAFEYINGEKVIILVKEKDSINLDEFDNIIVGTWIDKANANAEARKFVNTLANREFFLLDEPTSNLDILNEAIILKSLADEAKDKTVILVSHRESTLSICNQIFKI